MGNSPVTLDFSKAQPITLDFSKAQPLNDAPDPLRGASQATGIGPQPASTGWRDSFAKWADDVANDMRNGTSVTAFGGLLHKMGAQGTSTGNTPEVGEIMASLPLGLLKAAKGGAEVTQSGKTWQGTKDIVGGAVQAGTIPLSFLGGPSAEAGAGAAGAATSKIFGNVEKASQLFDEVKAAAGSSPVPVSDEMYQAASRAMDLADAGAKGLPRVISKFMNRVTAPDKAPVLYNEARDFYTNVSRLSANEYSNMNPQMAAAVGRFAGAFKDAIQGVAESVGKGDQLDQAMQLYARSKAWQRFGADSWNFVKGAAPYAAGVGVGGRLALSHLLDFLP